jgi:ABC-type bacteriocin/lantibiotic exporter with double-glycine peptidase domain
MIGLKPFLQSPGLCGPASLKIVFNYYGVEASEKEIAKIAGSLKEKGTGLIGLIKAAKSFGFETMIKDNSSLFDLKKYLDKRVPVIVDWFLEDDGHYAVVSGLNEKEIILMDPAIGKERKIPLAKFYRLWFDFPGEYIKTSKDLILRRTLIVKPILK